MKLAQQQDCDHTRGGSFGVISDKDFARLSRLIHDCCGIKLGPHKKSMLETRLRKRLRSLGLSSFDEYCAYVFSSSGLEQELVCLIDEVTTNKTDFFREPAHFDFLTETALPRLVSSYGAGVTRKLRVWSAGCASGEEPYTLAMVLAEFAGKVPGFDFSILASDISTKVLEKARLGVYPLEKVEPVPEPLKKKYLLRSRDPQKQVARVAPELRFRVSFRRLNFMDEDFGLREPIDLLFCRNVLIYFDRPTQQQLLQRLCRHLFPGRYLFTGHSETLSGMDLPVVQVAPSVYRRI
jgi:chemotaxis protein methyltransferase CheR